MIRKLYRFNIEKKCLFYDEAWISGDQVIEHVGQVGQLGKTVVHSLNPSLSLEANLQAVLLPATKGGFSEIPMMDLSPLTIEYRPDELSDGLLAKRHELEQRMNQLLGWLGLGFCDGGSIGAHSMEVFCRVVDFDIARDSIVRDLSDTLYGDYYRIFEG